VDAYIAEAGACREVDDDPLIRLVSVVEPTIIASARSRRGGERGLEVLDLSHVEQQGLDVDRPGRLSISRHWAAARVASC